MHDGTSDRLRLSFPATAPYRRLGRVTVAGLALRLGVDVGSVENLRLAVDAIVSRLAGPGEIELTADWEPGRLRVELANVSVDVTEAAYREATEELHDLVDQVERTGSGIAVELHGH